MERFKKKYPVNTFGYEIGKVSASLARILLSKTQVVTLSKVSLEKNLRNHPDLLVDDYLYLDQIIVEGHFIVQDGERTVVIIREYETLTLYHCVLKSTQTGGGLFLTSFRKTNIKKVESIRKKAKKGLVKILKDKLP